MSIQENIDYLTGIYNRIGLFEAFRKIKSESLVSVMFFDLDNFKSVNDMYGHDAGDNTLRRFAEALIDITPADSICGRLGGDEFSIIFPHSITSAELSDIANKILGITRNLKNVDRTFEIISVSIGIVNDFDSSLGLDVALSLADKAMYYAKENGKDSFIFYSDFEDEIKFEKSVELNAVSALESGKFQILYHPVLHLHSSELIRTEACCVWAKEDGTYWSRNDFRPILEKNRFIKEVDMFIFNSLCQDIVKLKALGRKNDIYGIQLSYLLILDNSLPERLSEIINSYGVCPSDFEINIDEKVFSKRVSILKLIDNLINLKEMGFSIAITKFGDDFSSIKYLKSLPISTLIFDGAFLQANIHDKKGFRILQSSAQLGRSCNLNVIACKAHDTQTISAYADCGFDAATGRHYSSKLPLDEYVSYIENHLNENSTIISYHLLNSLSDESGDYSGTFIGDGLEYTDGISPEWGAVKLPGGLLATNYIKLPNKLFKYGSYTVSMWLKPLELQNWISVFYIRYQNGFTSFMPNVDGGRSIYRVFEDAHLDVWHDSITKAIGTSKWVFVAFSFDSITQIARLYINGQLAISISDVPILSSPQEVWIGADDFQVSYSGLISALQITKGSLSADTITTRYLFFREFIS